MDDRLYFRQLLSGRDFAKADRMAHQMVNFVYAIGDRETGECVLVDPAYAVADLVEMVGADGMQVTGALATHHHPDHVGGRMAGFSLEGITTLFGLADAKVHVHRAEAEFVQRVTGCSRTDLVEHDSGDVITVGEIQIQALHTPGHTPGSQCFLVDGRGLVSGDTLFLEGCGRTDFPGASAEQMYESLHKLASLPDDIVVFPGHAYSEAPAADIATVRATNYVYRPKTKEQWLMMFGGDI